jgi:hypothetical protein
VGGKVKSEKYQWFVIKDRSNAAKEGGWEFARLSWWVGGSQTRNTQRR